MKLKYSIEINPIIAVLLIVLALFGVDLMWTRQRKQKRTTVHANARPAATSSRMPPAPSPFGKPTPTGEPVPASKVTVERDAPAAKPHSPFGNRTNRPASPDVAERVKQQITQMNADVVDAAKNGANAYVQQHQ